MLSTIRIILVNPKHPGNIGAAARAMKTMGLRELYLLQPENFPSPQAIARAVGADDILNSATVVSNFEQALEGCHLVFGTSARSRSLEKPEITPGECAAQIINAGQAHKCAILFGRERVGLYNEELSLCHQHIVIPANEEFSSLNLASAVQIIAYELRLKALAGMVNPKEQRQLAPQDQVLGFYTHLEQTLTGIGFIDPKQPKLLMQRLHRLFNRSALDSKEINILRGMLSKIDTIISGKSTQ